MDDSQIVFFKQKCRQGFKIPALSLANHSLLGSRKNDSTVLLPNLEFCSSNLLNEVCVVDDILLPIYLVLQTAGCLEILVSATRAEILKSHVNWIHPVFNLGQFFFSMCRHILSWLDCIIEVIISTYLSHRGLLKIN